MALPNNTTISLNQVNSELGRSATANINMNDSAVRSLAGVGGSGTTISMSNLWGKSSSLSVTLNYNGGGQNYTVPSGKTSVTVYAYGAGGGGSCFVSGGSNVHEGGGGAARGEPNFGAGSNGSVLLVFT